MLQNVSVRELLYQFRPNMGHSISERIFANLWFKMAVYPNLLMSLCGKDKYFARSVYSLVCLFFLLPGTKYIYKTPLSEKGVHSTMIHVLSFPLIFVHPSPSGISGFLPWV